MFGTSNSIVLGNLLGKSGSEIVVGPITGGSCVDEVVDYIPSETKEGHTTDPYTYGTSTKKYQVADGDIVYHIAEGTSVLLNLGFYVDPAIYTNQTLLDSLKFRIGEYDKDSKTFTAEENFDLKKVYVNDRPVNQITTKSDTVKVPADGGVSATAICNISKKTSSANADKMLYDTITFDITVPDGILLDGFGYGTSVNTKHGEYGTFSCVQDEENPNVYHATISDGARMSDNLEFRYTIRVEDPSSLMYQPKDKINVTLSNAKISYDNGKTFGNYDVFGEPVTKFVVISGTEDSTSITGYDYSIYNNTIDTIQTPSDADDDYLIKLSSAIIKNDSNGPSPYEKIVEVNYNVNNANAEIGAITFPKGDSTTPTATIRGYKDGVLTSVTLSTEELEKYNLNNVYNATYTYPCYYVKASDIGLDHITYLYADIGKLPPNYNVEDNGNGAYTHVEKSNSAAYGKFTTPDNGIKVVNDYHIYNKEVAYRTKVNGNLQIESVFTSTDIKSMITTSNVMYVMDKNVALEKAAEAGIVITEENEEEYLEKFAINKGYNYATYVDPNSSDYSPQIIPGNTAVITSYISPVNAYHGYGDAKGTLDENDNKLLAYADYITDPVLYITLPSGMSLNDIVLYQGKSQRFGLYKDEKTSTAIQYEKIDPSRYTITNITYKADGAEEDGVKVYKINFDPDIHFGLYDEGGYIDTFKYTLSIDTIKSLKTARYPLNDIVHLSAENPLTGVHLNGRTSYVNVNDDIYKINDGKRLPGIITGGEENEYAWGFSIQELADLTISNYIKVTKINDEDVTQDWKNYNKKDNNSVALLGEGTEGQIKVIIKNNADADAKNVVAVLPIPKKDRYFGKVMTDSNITTNNFGFTMDISWNEMNLTNGFTSNDLKYIKFKNSFFNSENLNQTDAVYLNVSADNYTVVSDSASADAIMITKSTVLGRVKPGYEDLEFYFDFKVTNANHELKIGAKDFFRSFVQYSNRSGDSSSMAIESLAAEIAEKPIRGKVYLDVNLNGKYDYGIDKLIEGATVSVKDEFDNIQSATTDLNGEYSFSTIRDTAVDVKIELLDLSKQYKFAVPVPGVTINYEEDTASRSYSKSENNIVFDMPVYEFVTLSYQKAKDTPSVFVNYPKSTDCFKGTTLTVSAPSDSFVNSKACKFLGWTTEEFKNKTLFYPYEEKPSNMVIYQPGQEITINKDTILYPVFERIGYKLYLDYQGGSISTVTDSDGVTHEITECDIYYGETLYTALSREVNKYLKDGETKKTYTCLPETVSLDTTRNEYLLKNTRGSGSNFLSNSGTFYLYTEKDDSYAKYVSNGSGSSWSKSLEKDQFVWDSTQFLQTSDLTIYCRWTDYSVNYDANGGKFYTGDPTYVSEHVLGTENIILSAKETPTRPGYTFIGWEYSPSDAAKYFDPSLPDTVLLTTATTYNDVAANLYNTKKDSNNVYTEYDKSIATSISLKAVWEKVEYAVNYDTDGGTFVASKSLNGEDITIVKLIENVSTTKKGFRFDHWEYITDDNTVVVLEDYTFRSLVPETDTTTKEITLKAIWEEIEYKVNYDTNGGHFTDESTVSNPQIVKYDEVNFVTTTPVERDGFTFDGWYYEEETRVINNNRISFGSLIEEDPKIIDKDKTSVYEITLKAKWTPIIQYFVVYYSDLDVYYQTQEVILTQTNLDSVTCTKAGYEFAGWYKYNIDDKSYTNTKLLSTDTFDKIKPSEDATVAYVVAKWTPAKDYTVTYNLNGGEKISETDNFDSKTGVEWTQANLLPSATPKRDGYVFAGWTHNNTIVSNSDTYSKLAVNPSIKSIELVAKWDPVATYKVNYDIGNATAPSGYVTADVYKTKEGVRWTQSGLLPTINPVPNDPTKEFDCWTYTYPDSTVVDVSHSTRYDTLAQDPSVESITLVAKYKEKIIHYTVKYNLMGGNIDGKTKIPNLTFTDKNTKNLLPAETPVYSGYKFVRWYYYDIYKNKQTATNDLSFVYMAKDKTEITLYAEWKEVVIEANKFYYYDHISYNEPWYMNLYGLVADNNGSITQTPKDYKVYLIKSDTEFTSNMSVPKIEYMLQNGETPNVTIDSNASFSPGYSWVKYSVENVPTKDLNKTIYVMFAEEYDDGWAYSQVRALSYLDIGKRIASAGASTNVKDVINSMSGYYNSYNKFHNKNAIYDPDTDEEIITTYPSSQQNNYNFGSYSQDIDNEQCLSYAAAKAYDPWGVSFTLTNLNVSGYNDYGVVILEDNLDTFTTNDGKECKQSRYCSVREHIDMVDRGEDCDCELEHVTLETLLETEKTNTVVYSKAKGNISLNENGLMTAYYFNRTYTYQLNTPLHYAYFYKDNSGTYHFSKVRSVSMYTLINSVANSSDSGIDEETIALAKADIVMFKAMYKYNFGVEFRGNIV